MRLTAYIDGASRGNPGPASVGVFVQDAHGKTLREHGRTLGTQTNNFAEYTGLLDALAIAKALGCTELLVRSDSLLLVKQVSGEYRVKNAGLQVLKAKASALIRGFKSVRLEHVPREQNREADRLANEALDGARDDQPVPGGDGQGLLF